MRYVSENSISFSIKVKGRLDSVRVSFNSLSTGGSTYSTDSEGVIEALEKSPMYGKFYQRAPECMNESVRCKKSAKQSSQKKKNISVDSVDSWQDAVEYLVTNCGADIRKLSTPSEILAVAETNGVVFPKLV